MIHESGIYVFESKNYSGWIFGKETDKNWTQSLPGGKNNGNRPVKNSFLNPILQNKTHIRWLSSLLHDNSMPIYSIIVFSERCELKQIKLTSEEHLVVKRNELNAKITPLANGSVLTSAKIDELFNMLYPYTQVSNAVKEQHVANIQAKTRKNTLKPVTVEVPKAEDSCATLPDTEKDIETTADRTSAYNAKENITNTTTCGTCPRCGKPLVVRKSKHGDNAGNNFYGCSGYPKCRYTQDIDTALKE